MKWFWLGLAVVAMASSGTLARGAAMVSFVTSGTFDSGDRPGTNTYLDVDNGISIVFNASLVNNVTVPPTSLVSFGEFDTSETTGDFSTPVLSGFLLDIFQTSPEAGTRTFVGTLSGTLRIDDSGAHIDFAAPLSQSIGDIIYSITAADQGVPGRVDIAPPSTNDGLTIINGTVGERGVPAVPEPSTLALAAIGGVGLVGVIRRRRFSGPDAFTVGRRGRHRRSRRARR